MNVLSSKSVGGVAFGAPLAEARAAFGQPVRERTSRTKQLELHYPLFIARFRPEVGTMREVTLLPGCQGTLNGRPIEWQRSFLEWACAKDGSAKEHLGYVICDRLGIALTGFHDADQALAITCYSPNDWDEFLPKARAFAP